MKFIDEARIIIRSGSGGAGRVSFRREKFVPFGGPDGGDGGKGGSVVFRPKSGLNTLLDFRYTRCYVAGDGKSGGGGCRTGANGEDCVIDVPFGTLVKDAETGETFADINCEKTVFIALRGGRGGKGNHFFRSATNQVPRMSQPGVPGRVRDIIL